MSFLENTIAFGQFYNVGGDITMEAAGAATKLPFIADTLLSKNINALTPATTDFSVAVMETGTYNMDFSFVAQGGDSKLYTLTCLVDGVSLDNYIFKFYQMATDQEYEVSVNYLVALKKGNKLSWTLSVPAVSVSDFSVRYVKLNLYNLQQLGIH